MMYFQNLWDFGQTFGRADFSRTLIGAYENESRHAKANLATIKMMREIRFEMR